ncbi:MAG: DUF4252 domain-containing protein [Bacteroidales bacterium]
MKRIIWTIMLSSMVLTLSGQRTVDAIFDSYKGKSGYITVNINGGLLKLAAMFDKEDEELAFLASSISRIRILALDDSRQSDEGFYNRVIKDIDSSLYEEFMDINSSGDQAKILVRAEGDMFTEFLMVVGGNDHALIQIKGRMSADDIKKLSSDMNHGGSDHIRYK